MLGPDVHSPICGAIKHMLSHMVVKAGNDDVTMSSVLKTEDFKVLAISAPMASNNGAMTFPLLLHSVLDPHFCIHIFIDLLRLAELEVSLAAISIFLTLSNSFTSVITCGIDKSRVALSLTQSLWLMGLVSSKPRSESLSAKQASSTNMF